MMWAHGSFLSRTILKGQQLAKMLLLCGGEGNVVKYEGDGYSIRTRLEDI